MPPDVVFTVKARFAIQRVANRSAKPASELLFDSLAQALPAGARRSVVSARQLLYRVGPIYIDMEIDKEATSDQASIVGQMLDSSRPGHPLAGVPVVLLDQGRGVARTLTNGNGEFHLDFAMKDDLKLSVTFDRKHPVSLPIANMHGNTNTIAASTERKAAGVR